ncbi:hypothetical protein DACRYDRAFT_86834 [Dacryopinax primogenitus]|uniref:Centrosomin N-terminal motif 1 domain-containing protein n=1 Tax=Dacryopinax primogenitus (strain DJM 731) TaxID=1858805 RepID=M5GAL2_DACPD|nr:uncharacterized protein DACRYDRAFT_86834 [Dacryopinax primogenitus]EJU05899.1 hypothetical protein DACRYDRAFT_86834 [Dacryopinax primogenitus]
MSTPGMSEITNSNLPEVTLGTQMSSFHSPPPSPRQQGPRRPTSGFSIPSGLASRMTSSSTQSSEPVLTPANGSRRASKNGLLSVLDEPTPRAGTKPDASDEDMPNATELSSSRLSGIWDEPGSAGGEKEKEGKKGKKGQLTLREQEKAADRLEKENFNLKLKVHFLEERLAEMSPEQIDAALKQNINLKIEVQSRGMELKKQKKLILELEKTVDRLQKATGRERERKLEEELKELKEQLRRRGPAMNGSATAGDKALAEKYAELNVRNEQLELALEEAQGALEENVKELDQMRALGDVSSGKGRLDRLKQQYEQRISELEEANEQLAVERDEQAQELDRGEEVRDRLEDELETAKLGLEELTRRREMELADRSESRAEMEEEREGKERLQDTCNSLRDQLASTQIELERKERECDEMEEELANRDEQKQEELYKIEENWRGELEAANARVEKLQDVVDQREQEAKESQDRLEALESDFRDLHNRFDEEVDLWAGDKEKMEQELAEREEELKAANEDVQKYGERVQELEEELDGQARDFEALEEQMRALEREKAETEEMHEQLVNALKDKLGENRVDLEDVQELYEEARQTLLEAKERIDELEAKIEDLEADLDEERQGGQTLKIEQAKWEQERKEMEEHWGRVVADKDLVNDRLRTQLRDTEGRLAEKEDDLDKLESAMTETRKLSESRTSDQFAMQLELDRVKRDLQRCEADLERVRKELDKREDIIRERENVIAGLHASSRDISSQLAAMTQTKLNLSDKLDMEQQARKAAEVERESYRARVNDLETRSSKSERSLISNEQRFREQIAERNTLLMTVFNYMEEILGVDKSSRNAGQPDPKPFTNFPIFHEKLMGRLKSVSQIQLDFDKRCKEIEVHFTEKMGDLKKQLDQRWKQIDRFETTLKGAAEAKAKWRRQYSTKEGELDALKASNTELMNQVNAIRKGTSEAPSELRALSARAVNAEKQLSVLQNRLRAAEEAAMQANENKGMTESKFAARVREYETREKASAEKIKRERQGAKEMEATLRAQIDQLRAQQEQTERRLNQLREMKETGQQGPSPPRLSR